jgi:hypothetical protein
MHESTFVVGLVVAGVLASLAVLHLFWAAAGTSGRSPVLPEVAGRAAFAPGPGATVVVAALLLAAAALVTLRIHLWTLAVPAWVPAAGTHGVGAVLAARAVGDFRLVGLFKRVRGTRFARYDSLLYTPLCLALAAGCFAVAAWS